jgi:hypothetical protein
MNGCVFRISGRYIKQAGTGTHAAMHATVEEGRNRRINLLLECLDAFLQ